MRTGFQCKYRVFNSLIQLNKNHNKNKNSNSNCIIIIIILLITVIIVFNFMTFFFLWAVLEEVFSCSPVFGILPKKKEMNIVIFKGFFVQKSAKVSQLNKKYEK